MRRTHNSWKAAAALALIALARAAAQEIQEANPERLRLIISIPDRKLAVLDEDARVTRTYDIAVGASVSPSPTGRFQVITRVSDPTYYHPGKVIAPGKGNPLGTRWIGLSAKGYGIHGTNEPRSIGHAASHGCIRMRNTDVEELFQQVRVGDLLEIHGERDSLIAGVFGASAGGGQ